MRHSAIVCSAIIGISLVGAALLMAGPLDPPNGPVGPTYKTLMEVEPRIAISAANTPGDADSHFRINQAGSYYLTSSFLTSGGRAGIEIAASGVTIDMNGFQIGGFGGGPGFSASNTAIERIVIRNGTIVNATTGISMADIPGVTVSGVSIETCLSGGIRLGPDARIEDCTVLACVGTGIYVGERSHVTGCNSTNSGGSGIYAGSSSTLTRCTANDNDANGIDTSAGCVITECVAKSNAQNGISTATNSCVTRCVAEFNDGSGIQASYNTTILDCVTFANDVHGITVYSACLVKGNSCIDNGSDTAGSGITAQWGENRIENNTCIRNYRGIRVNQGGNIIIGNTCTTSVNENWAVVAGNKCFVVNGVNSAAINGDAGGVSPGSANPWANFSY